MREDPGEEALMAAYAAGDDQAFTRLFALLAPKVYAFFSRSFRDRALCDELFQTTFLRIHRARTTYRPNLPVRPWVFTIAAHVRADELRRRHRLREDAGEEALVAAEEAQALETARSQDEPFAGSEVAEQVRAALDELPESQRVVVQLHRYEQMTFVEIAKVLGTSVVAVRQRAFRAYEHLRERLAGLSPRRVSK